MLVKLASAGKRTSETLQFFSSSANSGEGDEVKLQPLAAQPTLRNSPLLATLKSEVQDDSSDSAPAANWLLDFESTQLNSSMCDHNWQNFESCIAAVSWSNSVSFSLQDCQLLFLDVGSNIGMHTRFLYEPNLYGDDHSYAKVFDEHFGRTRDGSRLCSIGFEPNPQHRLRHQALAGAYSRRGWRYKCFFAAVGVQGSASLTFYDQDNGANQAWGFSTKNLYGGDSARKVVVPSLDLAKFVLNLVSHKNKKVVMKMDIEGSEYNVLPEMIRREAFEHLTLITAEFHHRFCPMTVGDEIWSAEQCIALEERAVREIASKSRATMVFIDDESFRDDGKPLPEPLTLS